MKVSEFACSMGEREHGVRACREGDIAHAATKSIARVRGARQRARGASKPGRRARREGEDGAGAGKVFGGVCKTLIKKRESTLGDKRGTHKPNYVADGGVEFANPIPNTTRDLRSLLIMSGRSAI